MRERRWGGIGGWLHKNVVNIECMCVFVFEIEKFRFSTHLKFQFIELSGKKKWWKKFTPNTNILCTKKVVAVDGGTFFSSLLFDLFFCVCVCVRLFVYFCAWDCDGIFTVVNNKCAWKGMPITLLSDLFRGIYASLQHISIQWIKNSCSTLYTRVRGKKPWNDANNFLFLHLIFF